MRLPTALLLSLLSVSACRADADGPSAGGIESGPAAGVVPGRVHPQVDNILAPGSDRVLLTDRDPSDPGLRDLGARLQAGRQVSTVGIERGTRREMFGEIAAATPAEGGGFRVLDAEYNEVRSYGPDGQPVGVFGGPGQGPGEFEYPSALMNGGGGRVVVSDRNRQIKVFSGDGRGPEQTIRLDFTPNDVCVIGDRIYAQGFRRGEDRDQVVHAYSLSDGSHLASFGDPYQSGVEIVRDLLSDGRVACDSESGTVLLTFAAAPTLQAFSADGEPLWSAVIESFAAQNIEEIVADDGQPGVGYAGPPADGHDTLGPIIGIGGAFVVQVVHWVAGERREGNKVAGHKTYALDAQTGRGGYLGNTIPQILTLTKDRLIALEPSPFPQIGIYALGS